MRIGNREFDTENGAYVMGILNVTPDSFSDGGRWLERDAALRQAAKMAAEGAAIIDIGGESTRPGHRPWAPEEEAARVLPVIAAVKRETGLPVSVDTYRHETARLALEAGADMVNDIWGLRYDGGEMARLIAQSGAACCLMHNRKSAEYSDFMPELLEDLRGTLDLAAAAGIARERIILDPGIGFAKSCEQNLTAMHRLDELAAPGLPRPAGNLAQVGHRAEPGPARGGAAGGHPRHDGDRRPAGRGLRAGARCKGKSPRSADGAGDTQGGEAR